MPVGYCACIGRVKIRRKTLIYLFVNCAPLRRILPCLCCARNAHSHKKPSFKKINSKFLDSTTVVMPQDQQFSGNDSPIFNIT